MRSQTIMMVLLLAGAGCATLKGIEPMPIAGDSLVLAKSEPGNLCFPDVIPGSVVVRSMYDPDVAGAVVFTEGADYTVDYANGAIARTAQSRIPDFAANVLYGQKDFDHNKFPGYGNTAFTVYVDYKTRSGQPFVESVDGREALKKTRQKLESGGPFKLIGFGDSIMFGGDASRPELDFLHRYGAYLAERFPAAQIEVENGATGGDSTVSGLSRIEEKVLTREPDLVLIGFGMNDHNIGGPSLEQFENNLVSIATQIREKTGAEVIVLSTFPPNPDWHYGSGRMKEYEAATQRAAERLGAPYADVYSPWTRLLARKDMPSMLGNNINHPNDFGHWLYLQALTAIEF